MGLNVPVGTSKPLRQGIETHGEYWLFYALFQSGTEFFEGADKVRRLTREEVEEAIEKHIRGWSLRRLSKVTLALLRLAVYEMLWEESIPASVTINEAVELAKIYGGKDDASYINGVLASVAKSSPEKAKDKPHE